MENKHELDFSISIALVDGVYPSENAKTIFIMYENGEIDYETATKMIQRIYKND